MTALICVVAFSAFMFALTVARCSSAGRETLGCTLRLGFLVACIAGLVAAVVALPFMVL